MSNINLLFGQDFKNLFESVKKEKFTEDGELKTRLPFKILHHTLGPLGLLLNLLTLVALFRKRKSGKLQLTFLASLTVSDMILALMGTVYYDFCFRNIWQYIIICSGGARIPIDIRIHVDFLLGHVYTISQCAGLLTMYAITIDILYGVSRPLKYRQCNMKIKGWVIVGLIWLVSICAAILESFCINYPFGLREIKEQGYFNKAVMMLSGFSFVPFVLLYSSVTYKIWRHVTQSPSNQTRSMKKAVITMFLIIGTYFVCLMPGGWVILYAYLKGRKMTAFYSMVDGFTQVAIELNSDFPWISALQVLYVCNSILDPIIYAIRIPEVRTSFAEMFDFCISRFRRRNNPGN